MGEFVLRVKTKTGQKVVNELVPQDKVSRLKSKLSELTGIPVGALEVLTYTNVKLAPTAIDFKNESATIEECGIVSGDTLIVVEKRNEVQKSEEIGRPHIVNEETFTDTPGILMKKVVPADNSCLFTSIGYVLNGTNYYVNRTSHE